MIASFTCFAQSSLLVVDIEYLFSVLCIAGFDIYMQLDHIICVYEIFNK